MAHGGPGVEDGCAGPAGSLLGADRKPHGCSYEGLIKDGKLESHGVLLHPNKDRYEGQFQDGRMDGYGVFVWRDGTIYRGEWVHGMMHGCGVKLWKGADGGFNAAEGKFFADEFVGPIMPCSMDDTLDAAIEADIAASQARSFQTAEGRRRLLGSTSSHPRAQQQQQHTGPSNLPGSAAGAQEPQQQAGNWWERLLRGQITSTSTSTRQTEQHNNAQTAGVYTSSGTQGQHRAALSQSDKQKEEKLGPFLHRLMTAEASKMASSMQRSSRQ